MGERERYERGWALLEKLDSRPEERITEGVGSVSPDLAEYIVEYAYGDVWSRPGLDLKTRELATVAGLIAIGNCGPQLKVHLGGMRRIGWTREEIVELVIHMSLYAGFPAALNALAIAAEVFEEDGSGQD